MLVPLKALIHPLLRLFFLVISLFLKENNSAKISYNKLLVCMNSLKERDWMLFLFKDVRANCFCASLLRTTARANSHATSCIKRARQVLKWTMIGQMAIAIALPGFNDLGRSVTPTFLFRKRFYFQLSPHCSKMNKNSVWEVKKNSRFLSTGHGILPSCSCKAREIMVSKCELILGGTSPVDQIRLIGPFKPYLAENISLQSSNWNILGLAATVAFFANEARFTQI